MNLEMKYDCIKKVYETSSIMYNKIYDFEDICQCTGNNLNLKIKNFESDLPNIKKNW